MIKPLNMPHLSSAKPRCGLQSISDLLPRLMQLYEMQSELIQRRSETRKASAEVSVADADAAFAGAASAPVVAAPIQQLTFNWYE